ncbi:MAG TPA: HD domain-containing protein [Thermomicrobiales bacterium]|nr:HD domain-containing protein [Thermomicrobiales bacterium]
MEPVLTDDEPIALLDRLGVEVPDREHAIRCAQFAGAIFDGAQERLELEPSDRRLAVVAALFHDSGYLRGARDHHRKSYDILLGAGIPGFSRQEQTIAACVARYHGRTMPNIEHAGFGEMDTEEQRRTRRLSAIVRLAAACDASHLGLVSEVTARMSGDELLVTAMATGEPSVDRDRMREAAGGFQALAYLPVRIEITVQTNQKG